MSSRELLDNIIKQLKKKKGLDHFYVLFNHAHGDSEDIKEILMGKVDGSKEQLFEHIISNSYYKDFSYLINETLNFDDGTYNAINEHVWDIINGKYDEIDALEEEEKEKEKKMDVLQPFLDLIYEVEGKYEDQQLDEKYFKDLEYKKQQLKSKITTKEKLMGITIKKITKAEEDGKEKLKKKLIKKLAKLEKELNNLTITQQEKGMGKYKKKTIKKKKQKSVKKKPKKKKPKKKKSSKKKKKRNTIKKKK